MTAKKRSGWRRSTSRAIGSQSTTAVTITLLCILGCLLEGCTSKKSVYRDLIRTREPAPDEVTVTWLGNASLAISDGNTTLLVDPFVTRPPIKTALFDLEIEPDECEIDRWVQKLGPAPVAAVFVSHSHYDHLMDAPLFAKKTGAELVGSRSTVQAGIGAELDPSSMREAVWNEPLAYGDFVVTMLQSEHGKVLFGGVPHPGTIDCPLVPPVPVSAYKVGETYQIHIRHTPTGRSALICTGPGWVDGVITQPRYAAETVFLGIGGMKKRDLEPYFNAVPLAADASEIIPIHFDLPTRTLDKPLRILPGVELVATARHACGIGLPVRALPIGKPQPVFWKTTHPSSRSDH